jgi:hypothetical protein
VQGSPVMVELQVGRWRCGDGQCARKIFTERVAELAAPWARRTTRLQEVVRLIGHGMGGGPGERLLSRLGMAVSDDTILRAVKRVDVEVRFRCGSLGSMTGHGGRDKPTARYWWIWSAAE